MNEIWRPVLRGEHAAQALKIAKEIAESVSSGEGTPPERFSPSQVRLWRNVLGTGNAGFSLLHAYLFLHSGDSEHADRAIDRLDEAADFMASFTSPESLYYGFAGIGWATAHLSGRLFEADPDDGVEIDELLLQFLSHPSRPGEYDLINGYVGLGIYALERLPRPSAARCLEKVVSRLAERAVEDEEGAAFFTPGEELLPLYRSSYPNGAFNLGMGHGLPGIVALLGAVCRAGVAVQEAHRLLRATVSWLLARELPPGDGFRFPHFYVPGVVPPPGRLAWCYGDLGISLALLVAARGACEPAWEREALRIARTAAARDPSRSRIVDAGICHGTAGAGHLFNRLYQATGDEHLAEAARHWFLETLAMRRPGTGVGGFSSYGRNDGAGARWSAEPGFLMGSAGVALALLAAASPVPPDWDRLLLVSLRNATAQP
ncbi:MAG TPA: lanthionine synthetase C family protein [Thermoanaerobaculia bacterium]|jgi:lantibiotic modifying enzyme|nr:lanthionine synthetase C family protein [Thermoanaerobaculia bacterium]